MKNIILLLISGFSFCQNSATGVVVDNITKKGIPMVSIKNKIDYTISNDNGYFMFNTEQDSVQITKLGYEDIMYTFKELKNIDTIFLTSSDVINLQETEVISYNKILPNVFKNIEKNYQHSPFIDNFFLRTILKRDNKIYRFEDLQGKVQRNSQFTSSTIDKLNYDFQILNQRKSGIIYKDRRIEDFDMHSLKALLDWYATVFIDYRKFNFDYENLDNNFVKISFTPLPEYKNKNIGYYIIDKKDYSIKEYFSKTNPDFQNEIKYEQKKDVRFRTIDSELLVRFSKNDIINKYYIGDANLKQKIEVFNKSETKVIYNVDYQFITTRSNVKDSFKANIKNTTPLFEINQNYNEKFWENQNQLLLTEELKSFINSSQTDSKEFKSLSNIKK